jgi:hypothetical protein
MNDFRLRDGPPKVSLAHIAETFPGLEMSSMVNLLLVKKIVIIVCFVPMACGVLGMTFLGDCANRFSV